jgi:hypothetical protein
MTGLEHELAGTVGQNNVRRTRKTPRDLSAVDKVAARMYVRTL